MTALPSPLDRTQLRMLLTAGLAAAAYPADKKLAAGFSRAELPARRAVLPPSQQHTASPAMELMRIARTWSLDLTDLRVERAPMVRALAADLAVALDALESTREPRVRRDLED